MVTLIVIVSLIGVFGMKTFSFNIDKKYAIIESDGEQVAKISLGPVTEGQTIRVKGPLGYSIVEIGKDRVRMLESPCPGEVSYCCYKLGWISHPGQIVVCIPNRVVIRITGEKNHIDDTVY